MPATAQHPANAAVVVRGYGLRETGLTATIDGASVDISVDDRLTMLSQFGAGYDTMALRLNPPPEPGQHVSISGDPSALASEETDDTFAVEYVADEDDVTPPDPPEAWWWDAAYYEPPDDPRLRDSCGFLPAAGEAIVVARLDPEATTEAQPALVKIRVSPQTYNLGESFAWVEFAPTEEFTHEFRLYPDQVTEPVTENQLCVEMEVLDAAGNSSGTEERCLPCRVDLEARQGPVGWCEPADRACPNDNPPETPGGICAVTPDPGGSGGEAGQSGGEGSVGAEDIASNGGSCSMAFGTRGNAVGAHSLGLTAGLFLLLSLRRRQEQARRARG